MTGIMVPLLKFYYHEDVRIAAAQSLPELLRCAVLAVEAGLTPNASLPSQLLDFAWSPLLEAMRKVQSSLHLCVHAIMSVFAGRSPDQILRNALLGAHVTRCTCMQAHLVKRVWTICVRALPTVAPHGPICLTSGHITRLTERWRAMTGWPSG